MIREHDRVVLTIALSDHGLELGDVGVVVHIYPRQEAYEVEFVTLAGQTAAIVTASANQIRPIGKHEIPTRVNWRTARQAWLRRSPWLVVGSGKKPNRTTGRGDRGRARGPESPERSNTSQHGVACRGAFA
jgi:hypothetical protein